MPEDSGQFRTAAAAEQAARDAEARAAEARARAAALREAAATVSDTGAAAPARGTGLTRTRLLAAATVLAICALAACAGAMLWNIQAAQARADLAAEYQAIARQGVVNLMSLDYNDAEASVARVLDASTGKFHEEYAGQADLLIKGLERSKVVTTVTVGATAVESMDADSAVVLVSARSEATNAKDGRQEPELFRLAVHLGRDGDQMKVSDLEFA